VATVQVDQAVPGQLPQPGVEGHGAVAEVFGQLFERLDQRFLDDVGGVEAGREAAVHAHRHHPPQPRPMPIEQLRRRRPVAGPRPTDELFGVGCAHYEDRTRYH
jgi:hypothetical protein